MMDEDSEVGRPRLQQVNALEGATLAINLAEVKEKKHRVHSREEGRFSTLFLKNKILQRVTLAKTMAMLGYLLLLTVKVVVLCSDDLWIEEVGRITHNALWAGLLNIRKKKTIEEYIPIRFMFKSFFKLKCVWVLSVSVSVSLCPQPPHCSALGSSSRSDWASPFCLDFQGGCCCCCASNTHKTET